MPIWKYPKGGKEVSKEDIERVLATIKCFSCGKEIHSEECPFAKLRAELNVLKESS